MAFDKDAFLTALDSMTVMELNDLVKAIEEKFGVSAAAMSAPAAGGGAAAAVAGHAGGRCADADGHRQTHGRGDGRAHRMAQKPANRQCRAAGCGAGADDGL